MGRKVKVIFVASECTPIAKIGGLGDVIGSLPKALAELGVEVKIILPFYAAIDRKIWKPKRLFDLDNETSVWRTRLPKSPVEVFLIYNKKYLSSGDVYFSRTAFAQHHQEIRRFKFFSRAVFRLLQDSWLNWRPDIIHCNDWHTGALVREMRDSKLEMRTVFTIHNLANQGVTKRENLMAEGIKNANIVTTVSPTYAKEILTKKYGDGLENLLKKRARENKLVGILNGVDYGFWPKKHTRVDNIPTFGLVSRLTYQKGIDLLVPLVGEFVRKYKAQFWFLGQGEPQNEKVLEKLAHQYPKNVFSEIGFDEKKAHRIYRESDFFLMPSRFEPSGLGQMISMHYGTVPIVRATGGLKDSVKHLKTGFVFQKESVADLKKAMELAVEYFYNKKKFAVIRRNCLKQDFSWSKSAKKYLALYKNLL